MKITHYSFGSITINGNTYTKDVIIYPDHVLSPWWRKEGHLLQTGDLSDIVSAGFPELIIGTGYNGTMRVPDSIIEYLRSNNINAVVEKTPRAVDSYNKRAAAHSVAAALHLTC